MLQLLKELHQATIFNAPGDPGQRFEPFQREKNVSAKRARMQSVQPQIDGNRFDEHGTAGNLPFLITGVALYLLASLLRERSSNDDTSASNKCFRQETALSSDYFEVKRNSSPYFGDVKLMRSSLSREFLFLQAPFLAIKDSVEAAKQRIRDGIEAEGQPTQNSAAIFEALGDIEKAANGVVAITQEGIESVERATDSTVTRERFRRLTGAIEGAAVAASEIIASKQLRLVSINSATAATENGGRSRLLAETVAGAIAMPRS
ncbi:MAG TPA: hypothetical protein VI483_02120 [Candidatus Paceibacterota bacterium]